MDRLIKIFIGGSSEGLKYAKLLKMELEKSADFDCTIWNKNTFQFNESFLDSLTKASLVNDFGIFIASNDDFAFIKEKMEDVPRDNVLFEYGLFLGALGNKRTFLLQEKGCKLPTDLLGYTTPRFKKESDEEEWSDIALNIKENILIHFNRSEIQLLPSTSLAIGYFNSFIIDISKCIIDNKGCNLEKSNEHHEEVLVKILIPKELSDDISAKAQVYYKKGNYSLDEIKSQKRPYPIRYYKNENPQKLEIIDIPTTLNAIRPSINLLIPDTGLGVNPDKISLERKELENFKKTLEYLVKQNDYSDDIVSIEWLE